MKSSQVSRREKKIVLNENQLRELSNTIKHINIHIVGIPGEGRRGNGGRKSI